MLDRDRLNVDHEIISRANLLVPMVFQRIIREGP